jgi:hypothetical protein
LVESKVVLDVIVDVPPFGADLKYASVIAYVFNGRLTIGSLFIKVKY